MKGNLIAIELPPWLNLMSEKPLDRYIENLISLTITEYNKFWAAPVANMVSENLQPYSLAAHRVEWDNTIFIKRLQVYLQILKIPNNTLEELHGSGVVLNTFKRC